MRTHLTRLLWMSCLAACARSAPVDLALVRPEPVSEVRWVPSYVDVRHAVHGWQRIPIAHSADVMEQIAAGGTIRLATSHLPKGRYTALRVGYLVPAGPSAGEVQRASFRPGDVPVREGEQVLLRAFCLRGRGEDRIVLQIDREPDARSDAPELRVTESPAC